jgi:hypothetical protein
MGRINEAQSDIHKSILAYSATIREIAGCPAGTSLEEHLTTQAKRIAELESHRDKQHERMEEMGELADGYYNDRATLRAALKPFADRQTGETMSISPKEYRTAAEAMAATSGNEPCETCRVPGGRDEVCDKGDKADRLQCVIGGIFHASDCPSDRDLVEWVKELKAKAAECERWKGRDNDLLDDCKRLQAELDSRKQCPNLLSVVLTAIDCPADGDVLNYVTHLKAKANKSDAMKKRSHLANARADDFWKQLVDMTLECRKQWGRTRAAESLAASRKQAEPVDHRVLDTIAEDLHENEDYGDVTRLESSVEVDAIEETIIITVHRVEKPIEPDARKQPATGTLQTCQSKTDGDCSHSDCPQLRDGEPERTGRHCPLWDLHNSEEEAGVWIRSHGGKSTAEEEPWCFYQIKCTEDKAPNTWTCTAHGHEGRAMSCRFRSMHDAKTAEYACQDAEPPRTEEPAKLKWVDDTPYCVVAAGADKIWVLLSRDTVWRCSAIPHKLWKFLFQAQAAVQAEHDRLVAEAKDETDG